MLVSYIGPYHRRVLEVDGEELTFDQGVPQELSPTQLEKIQANTNPHDWEVETGESNPVIDDQSHDDLDNGQEAEEMLEDDEKSLDE